MRVNLILFVILFSAIALRAQPPGYIGGAPDDNIIVTTSNDYQYAGWYDIASGTKTITGAGMESHLMATSRFLAQSTLGADFKTIEEVSSMGFEAWIDSQFQLPATYYLETLQEIYGDVYQIYLENGGNPNDFRCRPKWYHTNYAWWEMVITGNDLLRQRIALALSEILVVSKENSDLENYGFAIASYYDIFLKHAFGNYKDILMDVTLHPAMGNYLSHLNNPKAIPDEFIFPDENYAREFMQLFTLGVFELNPDGTKKVDNQGNFIESYTNEDIKGLAAAFTGLGAGATSECGEGFAPAFGLDIRKIDMTIPMAMYEVWHEDDAKIILGGHEISASQPGMMDIQQAIDHIFMHQNLGPFLGQRLIQLLVKSNPSPDYISRVTAAFNDNGSGERGDMKAIIKAILLDPEARECASLMDPHHGKLREPILRYTHLVRAMDKYSPSGYFWNTGNDFLQATGQHPMHSSSVFNFFQFDFQPSGPIGDADLVAPEFQLLNSISGLDYFNMVNEWTIKEELLYHWESDRDRVVFLDIYNLLGGARDPEILINRLDILLTHGQLSEASRSILRNTLYTYQKEGIESLVDRTLLALYYFMVTPDYTIFR